MNTRIQVEHPVTEKITGVDLVREQLQIAAGERCASARTTSLPAATPSNVRLNAEDPTKGFLPSPGR